MGIDDKQKHVKCNKNRRARYTFCCISLNNDFNKIYLTTFGENCLEIVSIYYDSFLENSQEK